jgi:serine/threonine protein kinase
MVKLHSASLNTQRPRDAHGGSGGAWPQARLEPVGSRVPGLLDLAQYTLEPLRADAEFVLFRGRGGRSRRPILVWAAVADSPWPANLRRMEQEYALRSELDPAYVVRCLSLAHSHGLPMLVLEDPGGTPLDLLLNEAMETGPFLRLAISVAAALRHVHSRGLVHRDIKPANILVNSCDQAWLMGLGVASRLPRERQSAQPPEFTTGTLAYMAPEQTGRMNRSIDSRSDLYALGAPHSMRCVRGLRHSRPPIPLSWCTATSQDSPRHPPRGGKMFRARFRRSS